MRHDHYVPITYLRRFTDTEGFLHIYDKKNQRNRRQRPQKVCRERQGDENPRLNNPTAVREILECIEPEWGKAVDTIIEDPSDPNARYVISSLMAYLMIWVPAKRRKYGKMLENKINADRPWLAKAVDQSPLNPDIKKDLYNSLINMKNKLEVDPYYTRTNGLVELPNIIDSLYKSPFIILHSPEEEYLITSDNPILEFISRENHNIKNFYLPLTPKFAVILSSTIKNEYNTSEENANKVRRGIMSIYFFHEITKLIVQDAERVVISCQKRRMFK
tara:strand:- start:1418 stop:2242 length:825 start_codon:yes stop_codon:yes gene_type:complete